MKKVIISILLFINGSSASDSWYDSLEKEDKVLYTNIAAGAGIIGWGIKYWDYGDRKPHMKSEGWFGADTKEGGADKLGHFYTNYVVTHGLAALYENWGYSKEKAARLGAFSSFGLFTLMEAGDSFSPYGMSYEDITMNLLGSIVGYYWYKYPKLQEKVDFRVEYDPTLEGGGGRDISTNYHKMKHLMAIKAEGFDLFQNNDTLKYLELHIGHYSRGYQDQTLPNKHHGYVGIGINLSKLLRKPFGRCSKIFNYYQVPGTYIKNR